VGRGDLLVSSGPICSGCCRGRWECMADSPDAAAHDERYGTILNMRSHGGGLLHPHSSGVETARGTQIVTSTVTSKSHRRLSAASLSQAPLDQWLD